MIRAKRGLVRLGLTLGMVLAAGLMRTEAIAQSSTA